MSKRIVLAVLWVLLSTRFVTAAPRINPPYLPSSQDERCKAWVDSVFSRLSLHEKVGQLIVATFPARADKQTRKQIKALVKKYKIGGLLFSEGVAEEQAILTNIAHFFLLPYRIQEKMEFMWVSLI